MMKITCAINKLTRFFDVVDKLNETENDLLAIPDECDFFQDRL